MPFKDAATRRAHYKNNKEVYQARNRRWYENLRIDTLRHYSPSITCVLCGFKDVRALTIDHIDGGGIKHRQELAKTGVRLPGTWYFYRWLRDSNYPEGYRVLCMNCQFIAHFDKTGYPHTYDIDELRAELEDEGEIVELDADQASLFKEGQ